MHQWWWVHERNWSPWIRIRFRVSSTSPSRKWVYSGKHPDLHFRFGILKGELRKHAFSFMWSCFFHSLITYWESVTPLNHLILCRPLSSRLQSFPASGSFPVSQLFASGGQSIGASVSVPVLPVNMTKLVCDIFCDSNSVLCNPTTCEHDP